MLYSNDFIFVGENYNIFMKDDYEVGFYKVNHEYDPFDKNDKCFKNLHSKANIFKFFKVIKPFFEMIINHNVHYFWLSCEKERLKIYKRFLDRIMKGYCVEINEIDNEIYVIKSL